MDAIPLISDRQKKANKQNQVNKKRSNIDKIKLPKPTEGKKIKKKKFQNKGRAAIYIGRIPHGFYEDEMNAYFNQFGKVLSTFVARSKKTGRSRGYGFVEFEDEEVAKIAAETMNNYLMYNRVLKCRYIPPEERRGKIFVKTISPFLPKVKNRIEDNKKRKNALAALDQVSYQKKTQKKINEFKKFFEDRGIDFSFRVNFVDKKDGKNETDNNVEKESIISSSSETEDDTDDQFGVLEIDESDNDIHFKTPPQVKKVIKRSLSASVAVPNKSPAEENKEKMKFPSLPEIGENKKITKGIGKKLEKKTKAEKPLVKSFKPKKEQKKKLKTLKNAISVTVNEKNGKEQRKRVGASKSPKVIKENKLTKVKSEKSYKKR